MGCGQSRMGMAYRRKWKNNSNKNKDFRNLVTKDDRLPAGGQHFDEDTNDGNNGRVYRNVASSGDGDLCTIRRPSSGINTRNKNSPGPILAQVELSSSQMDFFRMLDEKIASGKDYDSDDHSDELGYTTNAGPNGTATKNPISQYFNQPSSLQCRSQQQHGNWNISDENHRSEAKSAAKVRIAAAAARISNQEPTSEIRLSSWPNGSLTNYEAEDQVSRRSAHCSGGESKRCKSTTETRNRIIRNNGPKSWFGETYSAWPLRRLGNVLRDDRNADKQNRGNRRQPRK